MPKNILGGIVIMKPLVNVLDKLIIKDDFYSNPDEVRQQALAKEYHEPPGETKRLAKSAECTDAETKALCDLLQSYVKETDIVGLNVLFRYTLAGTQKKTFCHVDGTSYAGIVYLSKPEDCAGGTTIYKHKLTGDEIYNSLNSHLYDFNDESQWEILKEVEMVHNRLVMYPGQLFHALTPVFFGDNINNARLTQNIFIYRPGDFALSRKDIDIK